jgi:integrase
MHYDNTQISKSRKRPLAAPCKSKAFLMFDASSVNRCVAQESSSVMRNDKRETMGYGLHKLTDRKCRTAKPGQYSDGGNLYLRVDTSDSRYWVFAWKLGGRRREMGLGSLRGVSLVRARELAAQARADVAEGKDPRRERDARRGALLTFGEAAEKVLAALEPGWTAPNYAREWRHVLLKHASTLSNVPIGKIDTQTVSSVLRPIWLKYPKTADRLRAKLERILDWAEAHGLRHGANPARWKGHLQDLLPRQNWQTQHFAALSHDKLPNLLPRIRAIEGPLPRALELTILTACRPNEVLGARWEEIDFEAKLWTISKDRMKARKVHVVPLSDRAVEILRGIPRVNDLVFMGRDWDGRSFDENRPFTTSALLFLLRKISSEATVHGMRSSFKDWTLERTHFEREIVELCLAHTVGNAVERAYARSNVLEKRRQIMDAWADYLYAVPTEKVVQLHR